MVQGELSNMNFIGRLRVMQLDVYSHILVELSTVESSM